MYMSPLLRSLLEAPQGNKNSDDSSADLKMDDIDTSSSSATDDKSDNNSNNKHEEIGEGKDPLTGKDDWGLDDDNNDKDDKKNDDKDDTSDPPDGLENPDSKASDSAMPTENDEKNIQLNILELSELDRLTLKRKCLSNFRELKTKIDRVRNLISDNEQIFDSDFKDYIEKEIGELFSATNEYMICKFQYNNYEENVKNYMIFSSQLNGLIQEIKRSNEKEIKNKYKKKDKAKNDNKT